LIPRVSRLTDAVLSGASFAALWYAKRSIMSEREVAQLLGEAAAAFEPWGPIRRIESLGCSPEIAPRRKVSFLELSAYMHDQLLRDSDQMSMAHSLEVRMPLIGREVVETVAKLGDSAINGAAPKALLRSLLQEYLPRSVFPMTTRGFSLNWRELLADARPAARGPLGVLLDERRVNRVWFDFHAGRTSFAPCFAVEAACSTFRQLRAQHESTAGTGPKGQLGAVVVR
jgi:hypothetical protein